MKLTEEVLQKHVDIVMKNKEEMSGFIVEVREDCVKLISYDNDILLVDSDFVACVKIRNSMHTSMKKAQLKPNIRSIEEKVCCGGKCGSEESVNLIAEKPINILAENPVDMRPDLAAVIGKVRKSEFSMATGKSDPSCGPTPSFERRTQRGDPVDGE